MTYNVVIHSFLKHFLFDLNEDQLAKIIAAHNTGASKVSIPGEEVAYFNNFRQIQVFTNQHAIPKAQLVREMETLAGRFGRKAWNARVFEARGKDVTREKVLVGFGEEPKSGGLAHLVSSSTESGIWELLHPRLTEVSRTVYEAIIYKEAALNAFIEIDERVGNRLTDHPVGGKKTGKDRMLFALAEDSPIIRLFPDDNPDAKMMQEGYKFIFAGVMLAIRNPKGHRNFTIDEQDAIELLFLASRLLRKLDNAVP